MEFKGGSSQSTNTNRVSQPQPTVRAAEGSSLNMSHDNGNKKIVFVIIAVIAVLLIVILGWLGWSKMTANGVKSSQYQAIFLTNGQVYFGKVGNVNDSYVSLSDIYYLQVQQSVQPDAAKEENPQVSLAKLGSELHGPEDTMHINRDQILFWENLKDSGKVVETINKSKQQQ